jgi:mono/diheme cytochrome c family protein
LALPVVLVAGALAAAMPAPAQEVTVAEVGRGFFQQYCSGCHGPEGKGDGAFAAYLKAPPPDLTTIAKRRGGSFPETEVAQIIDGRKPMAAHGTAEMPIWGQRFVEAAPGAQGKQASARGQITLFVAYLRSIQQK